jgi:hypothetical protein
MKQTAVEFLSEKYMYVTWLRNRDEISAEQADKMRAQYLAEAKEMEKEQMCDTWVDSRTFDKGDNYFGKQKSFDEYYNVIFNTKEK